MRTSTSWTDSRLVRRWFTKKKPKIPPSQYPVSNLDLTQFPPELIRNFSIVAHIDHGKTTLSSTLLNATGTLDSFAQANPVYLDKLLVEKQRGITVKAQAATMVYEHKGKRYMLNLIDTPGHVDFSYEVSRSLTACEGVVLLVDAISGVQAQTMANFWLAYEANLHILAAINKIDMKNAQTKNVLKQIEDTFGLKKESTLLISAKEGIGINELFTSLIEDIPPPQDNSAKPFRGLLFDSWYGNDWTGVICLVKVVDGQIKQGDSIMAYRLNELHGFQKEYVVTDVGVMFPEEQSTKTLFTGQVGYVTCGMKSITEALIGDTLFHTSSQRDIVPFPGFKESKPMVFGGIYPADEADFSRLSESLDKLCLQDRSVTVVKETNEVLGLGYRCGFLGMLHMDVFQQRLKQEYGTSVITTAPSVTYKVRVANTDEVLVISNPSEWPEIVAGVEEPMILATVVCPKEFMGAVIKLFNEKRGLQNEVSFIDETRVLVKFQIPLAELLSGFYDRLKSLTSGFATFDYEDYGYAKADLVKVTILINSEPVGPLSQICHRIKAMEVGKNLVEKLRGTISRQQFEVAIQAAIGKKVISRETIKAFRKDVTAKCYGGDVSRRRKLLERQKEGKKNLRCVGRVEIPQEAFTSLLSKE